MFAQVSRGAAERFPQKALLTYYTCAERGFPGDQAKDQALKPLHRERRSSSPVPRVRCSGDTDSQGDPPAKYDVRMSAEAFGPNKADQSARSVGGGERLAGGDFDDARNYRPASGCNLRRGRAPSRNLKRSLAPAGAAEALRTEADPTAWPCVVGTLNADHSAGRRVRAAALPSGRRPSIPGNPQDGGASPRRRATLAGIRPSGW